MSSQRIEIRVTPALRERLEELAATRKTTLSAAIKSAILEAAPLDEAVPSEDEVLRLLGQAARIGNVAAMKELRAYYREQSDEERAGRHPLAGVDELAQRRVDQAAGHDLEAHRHRTVVVGRSGYVRIHKRQIGSEMRPPTSLPRAGAGSIEVRES